MPSLGEPVATAIKEHQTQAAVGWAYQACLQELHRWVDRVDKDFDLALPTPVIAVAPLRVDVLGMYRLGRNEIGARTTITLNEGWLRIRPFSETLVTLIHELLHAYEECRLGRERGGWYHTTAWRAKMADVGIVADEGGHTLQVLPSFIAYLKRYGVADLRFASAAPAQLPSRRRQLPKWVCGCPSGNPVRASRLRARCLDCDHLYRKVAC